LGTATAEDARRGKQNSNPVHRGHSITLDASIPAGLYIKQSKPHHLYPPAAAIICKYSEFLSTHSYVLHNTHIRVRFNSV